MKTKFPRADAVAVAREVIHAMQLDCERLIVAGSLRRRKAEVGDVEILYVPKLLLEAPDDWFAPPQFINLADAGLNRLLGANVLSARKNVLGRPSWGQQNKLAVHVASQIPVDLFSTTESAWWNYLVCRTGSAENNVDIASAAQSRGWKWHPTREGFTDDTGALVPVRSEREAFELVGLRYKEPWER